MNNTPVVEVEDLRKTYREGLIRRKSVDALRGVSLQVAKGEIFGLLGPNGAGKTTLIKVLLGIVRKTGGEATMLGFRAGDRRGRVRVGYLPESHRIPRHLTGYTALDYYGGLSRMPLSKIRDRRDSLLEMVGLEGWGKSPVKTYSKGMLQRLGLAQAMLHEPELLILDEPTDGVDPVGRKKIREVLFELKDQGCTVFLNSHLLQELELVCDRVAILDKGLVKRIATVSELTESESDGQTEIDLQLHGPEQAIRDVLREFPKARLKKHRSGRIEVVLTIRGQFELDGCIDALRESNVSIHSLVRRRVTLEDAFIEIVQDAP